ncbi:MAG: hypothetical protein R3F30_16070 [Planctomycetota bacterium]
MHGKVETVDGEPWVGATVHLMSWPHWEYAGLGECDQLELVTDERGRFFGEILQHRTYMVWAYERNESGGWRVTPSMDLVRSGEPVVLHEATWEQPDLEVTLECEDWKRYGPFRCFATAVRPFQNTYLMQAVALEPDPPIALPLVEGKTVMLPPLPWPTIGVEVHGADGLLLAEAERDLSDGGLHPRQDWTLAPDKPQQKELRLFQDSWNGDLVNGFELWQRYRGREVKVDAEVEDGVARLLLPIETRRGATRLNARYERGPQYILRKQGLGDAVCVNLGLNYTVRRNRGNLRYKGGRGLAFAARSLTGRLLGPDGKPPAGVTLLLWQQDRNAGIYPVFHFNQGRVLETDAEGRFACEHLGNDPWALWALLPDRMLDELQGEGREPFHPLALLATGLGTQAKEHALGDIRIDRLVQAEIEVDGERRPGSRLPRVHLFGDFDTNYGPPRLLCERVSRRGHVVLLLPPGKGYRFAARSALGIVHDKLPAGGPGAKVAAKVRIPTGKTVSGQLVDQQGRPLVGAALFVTDQSMRNRMRSSLDRIDLTRSYGVTDAEGRFELVLPELRPPVNLYVNLIEGGRSIASHNQLLDVDEGCTGLRIEVPVRQRAGGAAPAQQGQQIKRR